MYLKQKEKIIFNIITIIFEVLPVQAVCSLFTEVISTITAGYTDIVTMKL